MAVVFETVPAGSTVQFKNDKNAYRCVEDLGDVIKVKMCNVREDASSPNRWGPVVHKFRKDVHIFLKPRVS